MSKEAKDEAEEASTVETTEADAKASPVEANVIEATDAASANDPGVFVAPERKRVKGQTEKVKDPEPPTVEQEEEGPRAGKGETLVVYNGGADLLEFGDYRFRPGQPVAVPSDTVEELLTLPFEPFAVVEE